MSNHEGDDHTQTPRSFLNQWASMLSMMQVSGTSTPLNDALISYYGATQPALLQQQQMLCQGTPALTPSSSTTAPPPPAFSTSNTTSPIADFAENPPLFTCTYCPYIAMDAPNLEEHERQHHQGEMNEPFFDSSSNDSKVEDKVSSMVDPISRQLLFGFNSPTKDQHNQSVSPNVSNGSCSRQFGRALQHGQVSEMQQQQQDHRLSFSPKDSTTDAKPFIPDTSTPAAEGRDTKKVVRKSGKNRKGQFKCEFCDKVFGYQQNLNQHRRMHTGEKYKCDVCSKEFNFSQNLHQHMRVHSGKKEYKCSYCCKEFNDAANFHRHKRVIHGITGKSKNETPQNVTANPHPHMKQPEPEDDLAVNMPFTCPRCAMCFVLDSSLQKHLQHCVSPTKDEPDDNKNSPHQTSSGSIKPNHAIKQETTEQPKSSGKNNNSGTKRKRVCKESNVSKRSRISTENQENVSCPQQMNANEFQSCVYNQNAEYPSCSGLKMPIQVQPMTSPVYANPSPVYQTPSPAHQNHCGQVSSPGSSPTLPPPSTGYIFVCPYCGFGVTNNLVFREHLMHHRESICHQYQRILSQGQSSFEVIVNRIMISCMQLINPTITSPLSSSGSDQSISPVNSPTTLSSAAASVSGGASRKHYDTHVDPAAASGYNMIPDLIQNPALIHQQQPQYNQLNYQAFMHPAYLNQQHNPTLQQPHINYQHHPQQQHYSPPVNNIKPEMNDSGCVVEGEVSPWRLMMDRNEDSFRMRHFNH